MSTNLTFKAVHEQLKAKNISITVKRDEEGRNSYAVRDALSRNHVALVNDLTAAFDAGLVAAKARDEHRAEIQARQNAERQQRQSARVAEEDARAVARIAEREDETARLALKAERLSMNDGTRSQLDSFMWNLSYGVNSARAKINDFQKLVSSDPVSAFRWAANMPNHIQNEAVFLDVARVIASMEAKGASEAEIIKRLKEWSLEQALRVAMNPPSGTNQIANTMEAAEGSAYARIFEMLKHVG